MRRYSYPTAGQCSERPTQLAVRQLLDKETSHIIKEMLRTPSSWSCFLGALLLLGATSCVRGAWQRRTDGQVDSTRDSTLHPEQTVADATRSDSAHDGFQSIADGTFDQRNRDLPYSPFTPSNQNPLFVPDSCVDLILTQSSATIDTALCLWNSCVGFAVAQKDAPFPACFLRFDSVTIQTGSTLKVIGPHPLILLVAEDVQIHGTITASAQLGEPGPGGGGPEQGLGKGVACAETVENSCDDCGGGGGTFITPNDTFTAANPGGEGGAEIPSCGASAPPFTVFDSTLIPIVGGSGGAEGHDGLATSSIVPGKGGAGGGAIQISSQKTILLDGQILVGGGGGGGGYLEDLIGMASGGGGGSGGAVLLEAQTITLSPSSLIAANGGGGGGGTTISKATSGSGDNGPSSAAPAAGGSGQGYGGNGGKGASPGYPAGTGEAGSASGAVHAGGGGGGGLGVVRLNCSSVCLSQVSTSNLSALFFKGSLP
jgi:hypothetical protein